MRSLLRPAWPDEARLIAQEPALERLTHSSPLVGRCLNAGCGEGLYAPFLERSPGIAEIVHVDLAGTAERLRHLSDGRHRFIDASLTALPFPAGAFDSALCTEVLEHIPDDATAVKELARCLRHGGRLLLSVPHLPAPFDPNHVREGYTLPGVTALLTAHGFRVVQSARCFSWWLAWLLVAWRWQHAVCGRGRRNYMPRGVVRAAGYADRWMPIGPKWDLVVLAEKV